MIRYQLSGPVMLETSQIAELRKLGATRALIGTSTTYEHLGDIVSCYFLNDNDTEVAHLNMPQLSANPSGNQVLETYTRTWGKPAQGEYNEVRLDRLYGVLAELE